MSGVILSNHGGRQLDYAPATISALEEVTGRRPAGHIYPPEPRATHLSDHCMCYCDVRR